VLGEESEINTRKHDEELSLGPPLRQAGTCDGRESKGDPGEDSEHGAYGEDVVKVCDDIIGIMQGNIQGRVGQHNTREAPDREKEEEAEDPQHRCLQRSRSPMEGGESRKDLNARGDRDDYRSRGKICSRVYIYPHGEHMVGPDHEP